MKLLKTTIYHLAQKAALWLLKTSTGQQALNSITEPRIKAAVDQAVLEAKANEAHKRAEKVIAAIKERNKFETIEKSKHLNADRKLDSRLNVLINVQSELFYMTQDKDPDELTLSWKEVDGVIRREIHKVITEKAVANSQRHQTERRKQYLQKDASENR